MSRIYDDRRLDNLPVHNVNWQGTWDLTQWTRKGRGILAEGKLMKKARLCITTNDSTKVRYVLLCTSIEQAHQRQFDGSGKEIEPNFGQTTKVSKGYLNSSYDVKAKGESDKLSMSQVKSAISNQDVDRVMAEFMNASSSAEIILLMKEEDINKLDLQVGMAIRIKTLGDSPFLESLVVRDDITSTIGNFTGDEKMGGNWTDKIMAAKMPAEEKLSQQSSEIEDDEWDD